jgi:hypothetical protein
LATKKGHKKVTKYRRLPIIHLNIGMVLFGVLFIYLIINIIIYFTTSHITVYSVTSGPLAKTHKFTALALREETVVTTEQAGNIHYYTREGEKAAKGKEVYSIDEGGRLKDILAQGDNQDLSNQDFSKIKQQIADYSYAYDSNSFQTVHGFKYDVEGSVLELLSQSTFANISDLSKEDGNLFTLSAAPTEGIVVYSVDNLEEVTEDTLTEEMFIEKDFPKSNLRENELVEAGEPAYKLITDENWFLYVPLDNDTSAKLSNETEVKFKFLKDGTTATGQFSIVTIGSNDYGKIDLNTSMVRYATDRYLEIELLIDYKTGLKIPNSTIVEKEFFTIPKSYKTKGGNSSEGGFLRETVGENGEPSTEFISTTIYYQNDSVCYIDTTTFKAGDYILLKDSTERYQLSEKAVLQGVYNVNKGYAVFNQVEILDQNEEYCIVKEGTKYGLSQFDHIILDGSSVKEEDIVY